MYGKVFASIFDGSLYGHFEATAVMMALIALADKSGVVDMTPKALAARTGFPLDVIRRGLEELSQPDPESRSHEHDGRRIIPIDPERSWGWQLVNYAKYRCIRSNDDRREYMRDYMANRRAVNSVNPALTDLAKAEAEVDVKEKKKDGASAPDVWGFGIELLTNEGGLSTGSARSYLGALCKQWAEQTVLDALMAATGKADPKAYARKWLEDKPRKGQAAQSETDKLFDRLEREGRA